MQKIGEAELARTAEEARRRAALTDAPRRKDMRFLRVPRISAKGRARRPAGGPAARSA